MNLWNIKNLESPPINTYKVKNPNVDIHKLHELLNEALDLIKNQNDLNQEAAILSRCIYRMKQKFRGDKGLKAMEKMNRCLLQYLRMNFLHTLETFSAMVPHQYTRNTYLPTLNNLHYVLVRIQGVSRLMARIVEMSKVAAQFMDLRISIGHLYHVAFICYAIISRIFVLAKEFTQFCCKLYTELLPFTKLLENRGHRWLPADYSLPDNLKRWLDMSWLNEELVVQEVEALMIPTIFDIIDSDSDVEFHNEYTEIQDDVEITDEFIEVKDQLGTEVMSDNRRDPKEKTKKMNSKLVHNKKLKKNTITIPVLSNEDVGEVIKKLGTKKSEISTNTALNALINKIRTLKDLKKFEKNFDFIKKKHKNIFCRLDQLQSNMLHSSIKKFTNTAMKNSLDKEKLKECITKTKHVLKSSLV